MEIKIKSIDTIRESAREFIENIGESKVFAFYGKMGAGKTTFVKAICEELGVEDVITSPTFAIVNEYEAKGQPIFHFDFYRGMRTIFTRAHFASLNGRNSSRSYCRRML